MNIYMVYEEDCSEPVFITLDKRKATEYINNSDYPDWTIHAVELDKELYDIKTGLYE